MVTLRGNADLLKCERVHYTLNGRFIQPDLATAAAVSTIAISVAAYHLLVPPQMEAPTMSRWPWVTTALAVVLAINPIGWDFLYTAFYSSEALARDIARPLVFAAMLILAVLALLEWFIWRAIRRRRVRQAPLD